ncbi:chemotaxis protein CheD [Agaribacter marinus]|uniref:Probable chemoreceptor glutamine deamidase CheD n=1 Tax=Virgibacillus salarius TaxID=447199 RepID=A0A941DQT7_9BACI|nr:chemotaxis protein CheD [Virgibacillus salarius]MBR7794845.1 chemotaxis protein CheD [Virgibacillus salarius]NAZ07565.1 chemotaxis protein CheD [Agaribacter marinus]
MNKTASIIKVGIGDLNVVTPPMKIRTSGLGSCVGVVIYDETEKVSGLAHILLPNSQLARQKQYNAYKYADTAIPKLITKMIDCGANKHKLKAKIAGGAQMFQFASGSDMMRIGPRNVEAVLDKLKDCNIPVVAQDVGGNTGRTIEFDPETSKLKIRKINREETFI